MYWNIRPKADRKLAVAKFGSLCVLKRATIDAECREDGDESRQNRFRQENRSMSISGQNLLHFNLTKDRQKTCFVVPFYPNRLLDTDVHVMEKSQRAMDRQMVK